MMFSIKFRKGYNKESQNVDIRSDSVIKVIPSELCTLEAWRTQKGKEIGEKSGTFYVPAILAINKQSIVFEKINSLTSIRHMLSNPNNLYLAKMAGEALANIHLYNISVENETVNFSPDITDMFQSKTFMHGDFNTYNVLYNNINNKLYILDWAAPAWAMNHNFSRSHYFDMSVFIISTFSHRLLEPKAIPNPEKIIDNFLISYQKVTKNELNCRLLADNLSETMEVFSVASNTFLGKLAKLSRKSSYNNAVAYTEKLAKREILKL